MKKNVLIILAILIVIVIVYIATSKKTVAPQTTQNPETIDTSKVPPLVGESATPQPTVPKTFTVNYGADGFSPASIEINAGDTVNFVNASNVNMWPASNPHPAHTDYPEFDAKKNIAPNETYSFIFDKAGTWGYHNHKNSGQKGTVIVK